MTGDYKSHPNDGYDKIAGPVVENISYQDVVATGVWKEAAMMQGIQGAPFKGICMANVTAEMTKERKVSWNCADVEGVLAGVTRRHVPHCRAPTLAPARSPPTRSPSTRSPCSSALTLSAPPHPLLLQQQLLLHPPLPLESYLHHLSHSTPYHDFQILL